MGSFPTAGTCTAGIPILGGACGLKGLWFKVCGFRVEDFRVCKVPGSQSFDPMSGPHLVSNSQIGRLHKLPAMWPRISKLGGVRVGALP